MIFFQGFNLSILDCKCENWAKEHNSVPCFNLSILDCKLVFSFATVTNIAGFNLSILDCKSASTN